MQRNHLLIGETDRPPRTSDVAYILFHCKNCRHLNFSYNYAKIISNSLKV